MAKRNMTCCVCGSNAGRWQQHWNRDTGFGICGKCIDWLCARGTSEAEILDLYGREGVNWGYEKPPLCDGCGINRADPPSALCPGCDAYREHTA
jgi:hypothetical protein